MKTIAEIQQEIRRIKDELSNLDYRLQAINDELTVFKEVKYEDSLYQKIYDIANMMPVIHHPIVAQTPEVKGNYFAILIAIAGEGDSINSDQLLFLQRMILSDKERNRLEHYTDLSNKIDVREIIYRISSSIKEELAYQLFLDLLIITGLSRAEKKIMLETLADIASVMQIQADKVHLIAETSVTVLEQRIDNKWDYDQILFVNQSFTYYMMDVQGWKEAVRRASDEKDIEAKHKLHVRLANALSGLKEMHMRDMARTGSIMMINEGK